MDRRRVNLDIRLLPELDEIEDRVPKPLIVVVGFAVITLIVEPPIVRKIADLVIAACEKVLILLWRVFS